jgi:hypothetical protein
MCIIHMVSRREGNAHAGCGDQRHLFGSDYCGNRHYHGDGVMAQDDPLREAHAAIVRAIAELRALGVAVPIALHQAAHALAYAERSDCRVLPLKGPGGP